MEQFNIMNWRDLELKENIHYCYQNDDMSNVYKKRGRWWIWKEEGKSITFCPYCGIELASIVEEDEAPTE